jgi:hypothetical protein
MKFKFFAAAFVILFFGVADRAYSQYGGKAEPNPIKFARGASRVTVSGRIRSDEEIEYIFSAREGQLINVKIASVPKGKVAAFVILDPNAEARYFTKFFENYNYRFPAPHTGEYVIRVFLQPETKVKSARYSLTLSITKPDF